MITINPVQRHCEPERSHPEELRIRRSLHFARNGGSTGKLLPLFRRGLGGGKNKIEKKQLILNN